MSTNTKNKRKQNSTPTPEFKVGDEVWAEALAEGVISKFTIEKIKEEDYNPNGNYKRYYLATDFNGLRRTWEVDTDTPETSFSKNRMDVVMKSARKTLTELMYSASDGENYTNRPSLEHECFLKIMTLAERLERTLFEKEGK